MPVGRRLNLDTLDVNLPAFQAMFKQLGTMCEAPVCEPLAPAFAPYQSEWSFSFLCEAHVELANSLSGVARARWDRDLAEHMLGLLHRQSYVKSNVNSGFMLEAAIAARRETEKELDRLAAAEESKDRQHLRKQIRESTSRPGQPDDEILTVRQKQTQRVMHGQKPIGRAPTNQRQLLIPRLVVNVHPEEKS